MPADSTDTRLDHPFAHSLSRAGSYLSCDVIRFEFSQAMSQMYQKEVPLYAKLLALVNEVNEQVLTDDPDIKAALAQSGELERLHLECHGAIRLGLASELTMICRLFAVMGMYPVGYYDLSAAGVPVHSTAFRPIDPDALKQSPFRVFTSLLRLELIDDEGLRRQAKQVLSSRQIFSPYLVELIETFERQGGLTEPQSHDLVSEALNSFRWHEHSPISQALYHKLSALHPLIADVVGFKGPHINHLTPRSLDIEAVQQGMATRGIPPKAIIEGPPKRDCPILLRQTSFKALKEKVSFQESGGQWCAGEHSARFGEIEQRGIALTAEGRKLYDDLLTKARQQLGELPNEANAERYYQLLSQVFSAFPDDHLELHRQQLAYFYYRPLDPVKAAALISDPSIQKAAIQHSKVGTSIEVNIKSEPLPLSHQQLCQLIDQGVIGITPIVYEDFLPVSAAGIFASNLHSSPASKGARPFTNEALPDSLAGASAQTSSPSASDAPSVSQASVNQASSKQALEAALGRAVIDELALYERLQRQSLQSCLAHLGSDS